MDIKTILKTNPQQMQERCPLVFSVSLASAFKSIENKNDVYRGKDYMKKFCECLRKHAMNILNSKTKKKRMY